MHNLILVKPNESHFDELRAYLQEFIDAGDELHGAQMLHETESLEKWLENNRLYENKATLPNPDHVTGEQFLLMREGESRILGTINLRHYLNDFLKEGGGHIGYSTRPNERRKGYATAMLKLCLEKCREQGIMDVLVSCDDNNIASRKTIEACGGVYERMSKDGKVALFWIKL